MLLDVAADRASGAGQRGRTQNPVAAKQKQQQLLSSVRRPPAAAANDGMESDSEEDSDNDSVVPLVDNTPTTRRPRQSAQELLDDGDSSSGDNSGDDSGDDSGGGDGRPAGGGGEPRGSGKGKGKAGGGGAAGGKADDNAKKLSVARIKHAVDRVMRKKIGNYRDMPAILLQKLCTLRGIKRMSREQNKGILASKLEAHDQSLKRSSPHVDDVQELANGEASDARIFFFFCCVREGVRCSSSRLDGRCVLNDVCAQPKSDMAHDGYFFRVRVR